MYYHHSELFWGHTKKSHGLTLPIYPLSWSAFLSSILLNIPFLLCSSSIDTNVGSDNICCWQTLWASWQELEEYNGRQIWGSHDVILSIYRTHFPFTYCQLNVIKWVTFLPYVWELAGSDLGPETCCPDCGFLWFSSDHPGKYRIVPHIRPWPHP
jgi:hypothetical protein